MANTPPSEVVYEGEVIYADIDERSLADIEEELADFVELEEGEELHVSLSDTGQLKVQKLRQVDSDG